MKPTDKYFFRFTAIAAVCGIVAFLLSAAAWYMISDVNWLDFWMVIAVAPMEIVPWIIGSIIAWCITSPAKRDAVWLRSYLCSIGVYLLGSLFALGDPSVDGWIVVFVFGFAIMSLPAAFAMYISCRKLFKDK